MGNAEIVITRQHLLLMTCSPFFNIDCCWLLTLLSQSGRCDLFNHATSKRFMNLDELALGKGQISVPTGQFMAYDAELSHSI